jgi:hypothetical protein
MSVISVGSRSLPLAVLTFAKFEPGKRLDKIHASKTSVRYEYLFQEVNDEDPIQFNEKRFGGSSQFIDISVGLSGRGTERTRSRSRCYGRFDRIQVPERVEIRSETLCFENAGKPHQSPAKRGHAPR